MNNTRDTLKQQHATRLIDDPLGQDFENEAFGKTRADKLRLRNAEQNAQARLVLIQLQGLLIILMIGAMVWLGMSYQRLSRQVDERLKVAEGLTARMNTIDDRLFSLTLDTDTPKKSDTTPQNSGQLIVVQLQMAQTLIDKGDYPGASQVLSLVVWQLQNAQIDMAPPVVSSLQSAIKTDLQQLSALNAQNPWQADIAVLKDVGAYLRTLDGSGMTYADSVLRDARMLLSLSIGALVMKEKDTLVVYLTETASKLSELQKLKQTQPSTQSVQTNTDESVATQEVKDLAGAIMAIDRLLANPPNTYRLTSLAMITT